MSIFLEYEEHSAIHVSSFFFDLMNIMTKYPIICITTNHELFTHAFFSSRAIIHYITHLSLFSPIMPGVLVYRIMILHL